MSQLSDVSPVEVAAVASLMSDAARAAMLICLLDGRARTAGELAFVAGVSPQTASSHLAKLVDAGFVDMIKQGRHRYHRLVRADAAHALETLSVIAASPPRRARAPGPRDVHLREGRSCYDHLAGRLGVSIADALIGAGALVADGRDFAITAEGEQRLARLGVNVSVLRQERRPLCRCCIDWSERRPHIAGAVGAQLMASCMAKGWVERVGDSRGMRVTQSGHRMFREALRLDLALPHAA